MMGNGVHDQNNRQEHKTQERPLMPHSGASNRAVTIVIARLWVIAVILIAILIYLKVHYASFSKTTSLALGFLANICNLTDY